MDKRQWYIGSTACWLVGNFGGYILQSNPRMLRPAVQEESDYSAKRSGAVMYSACFRLEACPCDDATTMAAGRDVIR